MSLAAAVADVLEMFEGAGLRVVDDIRNLNPPCVYVIPPEGSFRFDRHRAEIEWVVYLVVPNAGAHHAISALSELVDQVSGLPTSLTTFTRDAVQDPNGGDPLPALRLSWKSTTEIGV